MTIEQSGGGFYARDADGRRSRVYISREAAARATERMTDAEYAVLQRADVPTPPRGRAWRRMGEGSGAL